MRLSLLLILSVPLLISGASCGPAIQGSSGISYWVYDHEVLQNGTVVLWIDPLMIKMLDPPSEGVVFKAMDWWK